MLWVISTARGVFEGQKYKQVIQDIIEHYAEDDESPDDIINIFCIFEDDRTKEICQKGIRNTELLIEKMVAEWREISSQESRGRQEIKNNYLNNIL